MIKIVLFTVFILFLFSCEKKEIKVDNYMLGTIEYKTNNFTKALELFKKDFKETKNVKSLYRLAEISHKTGDIHNTEDYLTQALKFNKKDYYVLNELAMLHKRQGRIDEAMKYFKKVIDQKEYINSTYYHIIDIYIYRSKIEEAEQIYKNNLDKITKRDKINYLFFLNFKKKDDIRYEKYLELLLKSKNLKILVKLTNYFLDKEMILETLKTAKIVEKDFPNVLENIRILGLINLRNGNLSEALRYFEKAKKIAPNNINNQINIATIYIYKNKIDEAKKVLSKVISKKKDNIAILLRGFLYYLDKDFEKSEIIFNGIRKKIGETMFKKLSFDPLINFYYINVQIDNNSFSDIQKLIDVDVIGNQRLLALKVERLNDLGQYKEAFDSVKEIVVTDQELLKQIFISTTLMRDKKEAGAILKKIEDNYVYKIWFNYIFNKDCKIEDKFEKYKDNMIYIDIYTDCLIRDKKFKKAKGIILNFAKNKNLLKSDIEYLRKKTITINYNILKQQ